MSGFAKRAAGGKPNPPTSRAEEEPCSTVQENLSTHIYSVYTYLFVLISSHSLNNHDQVKIYDAYLTWMSPCARLALSKYSVVSIYK